MVPVGGGASLAGASGNEPPEPQLARANTNPSAIAELVTAFCSQATRGSSTAVNR